VLNTQTTVVMSPLADPVVSAIFADKETAGLAVVSLIEAVLEENGEFIQIDEIISVTPQRHHSNVKQRGCRIDIEVATKDKDRVIIEVQTSPESWIMQRNLFAASRIFTETSKQGDTSKEMSERLPRVIVINILNYLVRYDNSDAIQPAKIMFTKKPQRVAVDNLKIYNVQPPKIEEMEENFDNAWYCWFYAMYKADSENKTLSEVVLMTPQLKKYSERDAGFKQYCEQYELVSGDPETQSKYFLWIDGLMKEAGMRHAAEEIVRRETDEKWQIIVAEKDNIHNATLAEKDAELAERDLLIAELRAKIDGCS
jgi:hypothetical protein